MAVSQLHPPDNVCGMLSLDKSAFTKKLYVPSLKIEHSLHCVITVLRKYFLKLENFKSVQIDESNLHEKILYLNPDLVTSFDSIAEDVKAILYESNVDESNFQFRAVILTYNNWKAHEIISSILPPSVSFSGFSIIGSIIHVNFKKQLLPYKHVIAQVLLEKMKTCKSVVNKKKNIESTFRNFEMEVLAGSNDLTTEVKENGCKFKLDFSEVYWNPRLHEEHGRIINKLNSMDVLYDVFSGIGPFAIPAAKRGCKVLANDLNPACCKWMRLNMVVNKIIDFFAVFNKSGDIFIQEDLREDILKRVADPVNRNVKFHITMNLPSTAYTFLPVFKGLFYQNELKMFTDNQLPILHLYCFIKNQSNCKNEAKKLVENILNTSITKNIVEIYNVRNVAPNKEMIRVSFVLTKEILQKRPASNKRSIDDIGCADIKKLKLNKIDFPVVDCELDRMDDADHTDVKN